MTPRSTRNSREGVAFFGGPRHAGQSRPAKIIIGETLRNPVDAQGLPGPVVPCKRGFHGSELALDALQYAPGLHLWRVELGGEIVPHGDPVDKHAASERTTLAGGDATGLVLSWVRWCALEVVELWSAPEVVRRWLETGDPALREQAEAEAARAAAAYAAGAAAYAASAAAYAAGAAAWAARAAAWAARAAGAAGAAWAAGAAGAADAAAGAAGAAARQRQREKLEVMALAWIEMAA